MHYYLAYPRSGWHWFLLRAAAFLRHCLQLDFHPGSIEHVLKTGESGYRGQLIDMRCLGYDFSEGGGGTPIQEWNAILNEHQGFLTLREAGSALCSVYHFGQTFEAFQGSQYKCSIDDFMRGPLGISRFCNFLNDVESLKQLAPLTILNYESRFVKESILEVPLLLGVEYALNDSEIEYIFNVTQMSNLKHNKDVPPSDISLDGHQGMYRKGIADASRQELTLDTIEYIHDYLDTYCQLANYRDFYL